jgi:lipid II:glycine glycyltransferase (peptidoglycan interpeptide bridge formation enzyme)
MITIKKKKCGLVVIQKWFSDKINFFDCLKITMYKQVDSYIKSSYFFINEKSYTLHSDLTLSKEEILKQFSSTIRNEIRRAEKEGSKFVYNDKWEVFISVYNDFALQKGFSFQSRDKLNTMATNLVITSTSLNKLVTAVHSYLIDPELKKVRLLKSATKRLSADIDKNMIARSNKFLHFMDMMKFKEEGYLVYDWGGVAIGTKDESLQGINKFKESFGGHLIEQNSFFSPLYYILLKLLK